MKKTKYSIQFGANRHLAKGGNGCRFDNLAKTIVVFDRFI